METVTVDGFLTSAGARPLHLSLSKNGRVAVLGKSGTGKSRLLAELKRAAPPNLPVHWASLEETTAKGTPQSLLKPYGAEYATFSLSVLGLWEDRRTPMRELNAHKRRLLPLVKAFGARTGLLLVDELFDILGPWELDPIFEALKNLPELAVCAVTNHAEIAGRFSELCVLGSKGLLFSGTPQELVQRKGPLTWRINTQNCEASKLIAKKLGLQVTQKNGELELKLASGQAEAVRLCLEGYAVVESVVRRDRTLAEALLEL